MGKGDVPLSYIVDQENRTAWITEKVNLAKTQFMDGINLDIEQEVEESSAEYYALTNLVKETTVAFHREIPGSQVVIMFWQGWVDSIPVSSPDQSPWYLSHPSGLLWCCLVVKMYRQALLWLCQDRWILWPAFCDVLRRAEPNHGWLYCKSECPTCSNTDGFVIYPVLN